MTHKPKEEFASLHLHSATQVVGSGFIKATAMALEFAAQSLPRGGFTKAALFAEAHKIAGAYFCLDRDLEAVLPLMGAVIQRTSDGKLRLRR